VWQAVMGHMHSGKDRFSSVSQKKLDCKHLVSTCRYESLLFLELVLWLGIGLVMGLGLGLL